MIVDTVLQKKRLKGFLINSQKVAGRCKSLRPKMMEDVQDDFRDLKVNSWRQNASIRRVAHVS
jgi:hypothetical protein